MTSLHASLSPSAAGRWIQCPASVQMAANFPNTSSAAAEEGTHAHELGELQAARHFGLVDSQEWMERFADWQRRGAAAGWDLDEMQGHITGYLALLTEALAKHENSILLLEQRLETGIEGCWGTGDAVIVSPYHVEVIDLKYGQGVPVSAVQNPQLRLYGLGALVNYADLLGSPEEVITTIYQPRVGGTSSETLTPEQLLEWRDEVVAPAAAEAREPGARFGPSSEACRWCPASGSCRPQMESALQEDFGQDANILTEEDLAEVLPRVEAIKAWISAVEKEALERAYAQSKPIPGYKVVLRGGRRAITDSAGAIQLLIDKGFKSSDVTDFRIKPLGVLEKLVGKKELPEMLGQFITKSSGSPALVLESAPGVPVSPASQAASDFSD